MQARPRVQRRRDAVSEPALNYDVKAILSAGRVFLYDTLSDTWEATVAGEPSR